MAGKTNQPHNILIVTPGFQGVLDPASLFSRDKPACQGTTRTGRDCKNPPRKGSRYCWRHQVEEPWQEWSVRKPVSEKDTGPMKKIVTEICDDCQGSGECPECHGLTDDCDHCEGTGACPWCGGTGEAEFEFDEDED
ncbi:MAG: hypothetical protein ACYSTI_13765 [Planctomycetota bacterium]|jgi:hypothetical protein